MYHVYIAGTGSGLTGIDFHNNFDPDNSTWGIHSTVRSHQLYPLYPLCLYLN